MKKFILFLILLFFLIAFTSPLVAIDRGDSSIFEQVREWPDTSLMYAATGATIYIPVKRASKQPSDPPCIYINGAVYCSASTGFSLIGNQFIWRDKYATSKRP